MSHELLTEIEDFLDATKMGPTYFGRVAVGNAELVGRLRGGGDVHSKTMKRVRAFINDYYAQHPEQCPKPKPVAPAVQTP